ncbi:P-loop containing nucleoside triphosphate hydrolase protein [Kockiozyma suomiensis]|uniref:P-loop containing nucleoside triphosphate hydrolase protein n=1 Tax=Kockiozyma suomiensis TaxID=1337062 RepID=UPI0033433ABB
MAEDGLIINLATPTTSVLQHLPRRAVKGRWTQRVKANRTQQKRNRTSSTPQRALEKNTDESRKANRVSGSNGIAVEPRERQLRDESDVILPQLQQQHSIDRAPHSFHNNYSGSKSKGQVVSSLFSSNPEVSVEQPAQEAAVPQDPSNAPLKGPANSFAALGLHPTLASHLSTKMSLENPTAIQRAAIPFLIDTANPQDVFMQAQTGSGKTLAYALPIINALLSCPDKIDRESGLFAIIIAPTRELANQILGVLEDIVRCCHYIVPGIVIGGEKKKSEKARLRKGVNILVSTPGRLSDHFDNTEAMHLSSVRWVVLDEGDRMTELGFEETITKILGKIKSSSKLYRDRLQGLPTKRVTILCSATLRDDVQKLGEESLVDAVHINTAEENEPGEAAEGSNKKVDDFSAPDQLYQEYAVIPMKLRLVSLIAAIVKILKAKPDARIMIFLSCSDSVNFHFSMLTREIDAKEEGDHENDLQSTSKEEKTALPSHTLQSFLSQGLPIIYKLHGSLPQPLRKSTLAGFSKASSGGILLCTDVASRGLDLPAISHVIEFDPPFALEDHLHRVGRTARVGHSGWGTLFVLPGKEEGYVSNILLPLHKSKIVRQDFNTVLSQAFGSGKIVKKGQPGWQDIATETQLQVERWILSSQVNSALAKSAFGSHIRAYTTHLSTEREYFNVRDLHLGHLAKSFGLRETPAGMVRSAKNSAASEGDKRKRNGSDNGPDYAKKRMLKIAGIHANVGADEFNLG